jgi:hypothetical protein
MEPGGPISDKMKELLWVLIKQENLNFRKDPVNANCCCKEGYLQFLNNPNLSRSDVKTKYQEN